MRLLITYAASRMNRFRDDGILAQNNDVQLYILVENEDGVACIGDLYRWQNPRLYRYNKIKYMHGLGKMAAH